MVCCPGSISLRNIHTLGGVYGYLLHYSMETWILWGLLNRLLVLPKWLAVCLKHSFLKKVICPESSPVTDKPSQYDSEFDTPLRHCLALSYDSHDCNINSLNLLLHANLKTTSAVLLSLGKLFYSVIFPTLIVCFVEKSVSMYFTCQQHAGLVWSDANKACLWPDQQIV